MQDFITMIYKGGSALVSDDNITDEYAYAYEVGLLRNMQAIPHKQYENNTEAVCFGNYNIGGFYWSSIEYCKNSLAESLLKTFKKDIAVLTSDTINDELIEPEIIGSLYTAHLSNFSLYFRGWLKGKKEKITDFELKKPKIINWLRYHITHDSHTSNEKLFETLIKSLELTITFENEESKENEIGRELNKYKKWQIWYKREPAILEVLNYTISTLGKNIINLQEANAEPLRKIENHLKEKAKNYNIVAFSNQTGVCFSKILKSDKREGFKAQDDLGFFNAILYDADRYKLSKTKQYWLSETPQNPSPTPGGIEYQYNSITAIILQDGSHNDRELAVFNTHITPSIKGHEFSHNKIFEIVKTFLAEHKDPPFILSGDFNTFSDSNEEANYYRQYMLELGVMDWRDTFNNKICTKQIIANTTFFGYSFDTYLNKVDEQKMKTSPICLDQIFSKGFKSSGNGVKYAFPIKFNDKGSCELLGLEINEDKLSDDEFNKRIINHETASDHGFIGGQFIYNS